MRQFRTLEYAVEQKILPEMRLRLHDAGHILGSAIVEVFLEERGVRRKLVYSARSRRRGGRRPRLARRDGSRRSRPTRAGFLPRARWR